MSISHENYLQLALAQAEQGLGFCAPNPAVGAVIVRSGEIIAVGYHRGPGRPHAEVDALRQAGADAKGANLYVTLEPCCHYGRTPPCVDAVRAAGIRAVYFAQVDPNTVVSGKGQAQLRAWGIPCEQVTVPSIYAFYAPYRQWTQTQQPWVTAKLAMSQDKKIAGPHGKPMSITGEACRQFTHAQRLKHDALITTVQTILCDDPQLNVRLMSSPIAKPIYVLDTTLRLPLTARVLTSGKSVTCFHRADAPAARRQALEAIGVRCVVVSVSDGLLSVSDMLNAVGADGHHTLWLEAGGRCFQSFVSTTSNPHGRPSRAVQRVFLYQSPHALGEDALPAFTSDFNPLDFFSSHRSFFLGADQVIELT